MSAASDDPPVRTRVESGIYTYTMPSGATGWEINWQEAGRTRWQRLGSVGIKRAREKREAQRVRARGSTTPAASRTTTPLVIDYVREVADALYDEHRPNTRVRWAALTSDVSEDPRLLATPAGRAEAALPGHMAAFAGVRLAGDLTDVCAKWLKAMQDPKLVRNRLVRTGTAADRVWERQRGAYDKATRRSYYDIMKRVFDTAVEDGFLTANPLGKKKTRRPGTSPPRLRVLDPDEQRRLLDAASPQHCTLLLVALYAGVRINEELALLWENVDLERLLIRVTHQMDGRQRVPYLKTDAGYREIWIPSALGARLAALRARSRWHRSEDYVFATQDGGPKNDGNVRKDALYPAVRRAGLDVGRRKEDRVVFHSLRHSYVSMLISNRDLSEATIARLVGHGSTITLRLTYEHLFNQHRDESEVRRHAGVVLDEVLAPDAGPDRPDLGQPQGASANPARGDDHDGQALAVRRTLILPGHLTPERRSDGSALETRRGSAAPGGAGGDRSRRRR